ncbi:MULTISPECIES: hypothetical protein [Pseudoalteromonas]|uniref:hypothetical protein n=1 Tax=Pseudoalteromonas TaxID=53246 RepID=UPI0016033BD6|nr:MULTISPECIES: hypothetical protein [Pseudoalteromonas]MBB1347499.1 hypothetical protein [Pseudoalteromonas sp. SG45-2]|tara:strand:- start:43267 stop:43629 length:363 start_codon:yes stop_codon:yes gene_type:complete
MRFGVTLLFLIFSSHSYACFSGVGYEQNWSDSINLLFISLVVGILATIIRYFQKVKRLYIPITLLVLACIPSGLEMLRYGNGDCGSSLMQVATWPIYTMSIVLLYEVVKLLKLRLGVGNT